tara:strand:- start:187 stop:792 length:606 start_codon:yes stop_codon:yes gene_type:complete
MFAFNRSKPLLSEKGKKKSIGYFQDHELDSKANKDFINLKRAGCKLIFKDSSVNLSNNQIPHHLQLALNTLRAGDELVIPRIDLFSRNTLLMISIFDLLKKKESELRSLDEIINTGLLGEHSYQIIKQTIGILFMGSPIHKAKISNSERIPNKNLGGRPKIDQEREGLILRLRNDGYSYRSIKRQTGIALSTIRRIIVDNK